MESQSRVDLWRGIDRLSTRGVELGAAGSTDVEQDTDTESYGMSMKRAGLRGADGTDEPADKPWCSGEYAKRRPPI